MAQIQPITFPLNLGTANELEISLSISSELDGGKILYMLNDTSQQPIKRLSIGNIILTEEQVTADGFDKTWALNYTADELGVNLIS